MQIVILLYKGFTAMDVVGAYEILCRLPQANVVFAAKEKGVIESEYPSMKMMATENLGDIQYADLLLVPGSTYSFTQMAKDDELLQQIKRIDQKTRWTVSVCTGAVILGAAGLLKGKKATTHWAAMDSLAKFGATPQSVRYVRDGKLITAAGISAGIDMALFLAGLVVDESYTRMLQLVIEYFPQPPVNLPGATAVPVKTREDAAAFLKSEMMKMGQEWLG